MEEEEVLNLDKICRLCLLEKSSMLRIFAKKKRANTTPLPIRIMTCTSLEVYQGDGLPTRICGRCLWSVNQAFSFREQCETANTRLQKYVHNLKQVSHDLEPNHSVEAEMETDTQEGTAMQYLDGQITIIEHLPQRDALLIKSENDIKDEPDDEEDDRPISELQKRSRVIQKVEQSPPSTVASQILRAALAVSEAAANHDSVDVDDDEKKETDSDSDLDAEPASALVETEMQDEVKPSLPEVTVEPVGMNLYNAPPPMSVRQLLEAEFSRDPTYGHPAKKFYVVGSSELTSPDKRPRPTTGSYGRKNWETYAVVDLKPRRKYAPREKNLISSNSNPIIEQDGTKSKFRACTHCGKVVLGKNMGIHVKIHVGNKSHLCDICGKSFLYKKTLETHKRVHSGERPCVCKICDKTFRSSSRLSDHMSTHTGRKPFICEICAVAFRIKGHLKKHLRVHSGEKPYICHFCEKAFSDAWNMKCHLRIHTGEKPPHACPVCGQCFLRRNKMEEHCKLTHGEEYVLPRKQAIVQRLKNDLIEMNEDLRTIAEREREDMIRQETERQLLHNHFESQRHELAEHMGLAVPMSLPVPVPAFPGNLPAGIFGLQ